MEGHATGIMSDVCKSPKRCITEYLMVGSALSSLINNKDLEAQWQEVQIAVRQAQGGLEGTRLIAGIHEGSSE